MRAPGGGKRSTALFLTRFAALPCPSCARSLKVAIVGTGSVALLLYARIASSNVAEQVFLVSTTGRSSKGVTPSRADALSHAGVLFEDCRPLPFHSQRRSPEFIRLPHVVVTESLPGFSDCLSLLTGELMRRKGTDRPSMEGSIAGQCDVVFLVGAAYQSVEATAAAAVLMSRTGPCAVVPMYNGGFTLEFVEWGLRMLLSDGALANAGESGGSAAPSVVYATTSHGANLVRCPGHAQFRLLHTGEGPTVLVPTLSMGQKQGGFDAVALLRRVLTQAGFAELRELTSPDLHAARWSKLAVNAIINPLTALYDVPNGAVADALSSSIPLSMTPMQKTAEGLLEAVHCAMTYGTPSITPVDMSGIPGWEGWNAHAAFGVLRGRIVASARATAGNASSMRRAVMSGRPSEVEFILGWIDRAWQSAEWYPSTMSALRPSLHTPSSQLVLGQSPTRQSVISDTMARVLSLEVQRGGRSTDPEDADAAKIWRRIGVICASDNRGV